jgi:hypothetical protein
MELPNKTIQTPSREEGRTVVTPRVTETLIKVISK